MIDLRSFPDPTTETSNTFSVDVAFGVADAFSGVGWWALHRRLLGSVVWAEHASGFGHFAERSIPITVTQPRTFELRVVAVDGQGNQATSPTRLVTFPFDDASATLASGYSGTWTPGDAGALDYRGTLRTSVEAGAALTLTFTGTYAAWIARGAGGGEIAPGTANVTIDGGPPQLVDLASFTGHHRTVFDTSLPSGMHTIAISVVSGTVSIDALALR